MKDENTTEKYLLRHLHDPYRLIGSYLEKDYLLDISLIHITNTIKNPSKAMKNGLLKYPMLSKHISLKNTVEMVLFKNHEQIPS